MTDPNKEHFEPEQPPSNTTIREAYVEASSFLRGRGIMEPESCAQQLAEHVLGLTRSELFLRFADIFPSEATGAWREAVSRKGRGEPLQYIIGEQEFYGLPFTVNPAVLIPRPETELLVEALIQHGRRMWPCAADNEGRGLQQPVLVDIGTGSGAIAVTIASICTDWRVTATDISPAALGVAQKNVERNGVGKRIDWLTGDLLQPVIAAGLAPNILVSNPPYIPSRDIMELQPEVRIHEPHLALDGGPDGLEPYRRIVMQMADLPAYPALVGFEVGIHQAEAVTELLSNLRQWDWVETVPDLAGIARHVIAGRGFR
ncbi:MAG: peptide chain release factor N(5)-glutamine methyltransferase [Gorillibacterium sp.]|nr:peptide chain release factor N(5)-glutamine methyltransferase [Gorillibacterium sp.]